MPVDTMLDMFIKELRIHEVELQNKLRENSNITYHKKGSVIIKENVYIKVLKIVLSGSVRVYQQFEDREILIYYLNKMETCTLSLSACFENCKSNVNAIAEEDCYILNIPVRFVEDWSFTYKSWNTFTMKTFRDSYHILLDKYSKIAFAPLKDRLLEYLITAASNGTLKCSHQKIAKELGTSREVISRLLKKIESEGKIAMRMKEIEILHP